MKVIAQIVLAATLVVAVPAFAGSSHGWVYWTERERDTIKRSHLDGTGVEIVHSATDGVNARFGLHVNPSAGYVYWTSGMMYLVITMSIASRVCVDIRFHGSAPPPVGPRQRRRPCSKLPKRKSPIAVARRPRSRPPGQRHRPAAAGTALSVQIGCNADLSDDRLVNRISVTVSLARRQLP